MSEQPEKSIIINKIKDSVLEKSKEDKKENSNDFISDNLVSFQDINKLDNKKKKPNIERQIIKKLSLTPTIINRVTILKNKEKEMTLTERIREKIYKLESKIPYILDLYRDQGRSRLIFVYLIGLLATFLLLQLFPIKYDTSNKASQIKKYLNLSEILYTGLTFSNYSSYYLTVQDEYEKLIPFIDVHIKIEDILNERSSSLDCSRSSMYNRLFKIEALRFRDVCKVYFNETNIINTGNIGIGKVNSTIIKSGPTGKYEISHNFYSEDYEKNMKIYNYDINNNNNRNFSNLLNLIDNYRITTKLTKVSISNNFFSTVKTTVYSLTVNNKPPLYATIGVSLEIQPTLIVKDQTGAPIQGKIVIAFSWYSHSYVNDDLYYFDGQKFSYLENTISRPSDSNGIVEFENLKIIGSNSKYVYILFYCDNVIETWHYEPNYNSILFTENIFSPPIEIISKVSTLKVKVIENLNITEGYFLTPDIAPIVNVLDNNGNGLANKMVFVQMKGNYYTNYTSYYPNFEDLNHKSVLFPIKGNYSFNVIENLYSDVEVFSDPVLTDNEGKVIMDQFIFDLFSNNSINLNFSYYLTFICDGVEWENKWRININPDRNKGFIINLINNSTKIDINHGKVSTQLSFNGFYATFPKIVLFNNNTPVEGLIINDYTIPNSNDFSYNVYYLYTRIAYFRSPFNNLKYVFDWCANSNCSDNYYQLSISNFQPQLILQTRPYCNFIIANLSFSSVYLGQFFSVKGKVINILGNNIKEDNFRVFVKAFNQYLNHNDKNSFIVLEQPNTNTKNSISATVDKLTGEFTISDLIVSFAPIGTIFLYVDTNPLINNKIDSICSSVYMNLNIVSSIHKSKLNSINNLTLFIDDYINNTQIITTNFSLLDSKGLPSINKKVYIGFNYVRVPYYLITVKDLKVSTNFIKLMSNQLTSDSNGNIQIELAILERNIGSWGLIFCIDGVISLPFLFYYLPRNTVNIKIIQHPLPSISINSSTIINDIDKVMMTYPKTFTTYPIIEVNYNNAPLTNVYVIPILIDDAFSNNLSNFSHNNASINLFMNQIKGVDKDSLVKNKNAFIKNVNENIFFSNDLFKTNSSGRVMIPIFFKGVSNKGCYKLIFAVGDLVEGDIGKVHFSDKSNTFCLQNSLSLYISNLNSLQTYVNSNTDLKTPISVRAIFDYQPNIDYFFSFFIIPKFEKQTIFSYFLSSEDQVSNNYCEIKVRGRELSNTYNTNNDCGNYSVLNISNGKISMDILMNSLIIEKTYSNSMELFVGQMFDIFNTSIIDPLNSKIYDFNIYNHVNSLKINDGLKINYTKTLGQTVQFTVQAFLDPDLLSPAYYYKIKCTIISSNLNFRKLDDSIINEDIRSTIENSIALSKQDFKLDLNSEQNVFTSVTDLNGTASFSILINRAISGQYHAICWDQSFTAFGRSNNFNYINYLNNFTLTVYEKDLITPYNNSIDKIYSNKAQRVGFDDFSINLDKSFKLNFTLNNEALQYTSAKYISEYLLSLLMNKNILYAEEILSELDTLNSFELMCLNGLIKNHTDLTKYPNLFQQMIMNNSKNSVSDNVSDADINNFDKIYDLLKRNNFMLVQEIKISLDSVNLMFINNDCNRTKSNDFSTIIDKIYKVIMSGLSSINDDLTITIPQNYEAYKYNNSIINDYTIIITNLKFNITNTGSYRIKLDLGTDLYFPYTFEIQSIYLFNGINLEWITLILMTVFCFFSNVIFNSKYLLISSVSALFLESVIHYYASSDYIWFFTGYIFLFVILIHLLDMIRIFFWSKEDKKKLLYYSINEIFLEYSYQRIFNHPSEYWLARIDNCQSENTNRLAVINKVFYIPKKDMIFYKVSNELLKDQSSNRNLSYSLIENSSRPINIFRNNPLISKSNISLIELALAKDKPLPNKMICPPNNREVISMLPAEKDDILYKENLEISKDKTIKEINNYLNIEKKEDAYSKEMDPINSHLNLEMKAKLNRILSNFTSYFDSKVVIHDCIYFPQRILTPLLLGFISITFITYKSVIFFSSIVDYVNFIKEKIQLKIIVQSSNIHFDSITNVINTNNTSTKLDIDSIFDEISKFVDNFVMGAQTGMIVSTVFAYLVYLCSIFFLLVDFKSRVLLLRQNRPNFIRKDTKISAALGFVGGYMANAVLSFIIVLIIFLILGGFFALIQFWLLIIQLIFTTFLNVLILAIINIFILYLVKKIICAQDYVRFPRLLGYFEIYIIFSKLYTGLVSSMVRLIMLIFAVTISAFRVDQSSFPFWIYKIINLDIINNSYLGLVHMYHTHNHPFLSSFVNILQSLIKMKKLKSLKRKNEQNYFKKKIKFAQFLHYNKNIQ